MTTPAVTTLEQNRQQRRGLLLSPSDVPLRAEPSTPDGNDGDRVALVQGLWASQDPAYRQRDREIEEHVRMLVGQQWSVYNPLLGRWIDVAEYLSEDERRWRQRPVFNRLLPWFMLQHARMTENPPIVTFVPGPDRADAELAETLDTIAKAIAREAGMAEAWDRCVAWMLVAGVAYTLTEFDNTLGELRPKLAEAPVPVVDAVSGEPIPGPDGQPLTETMPDVPLGEQDEPLMQLALGPDGSMQPVPLGEPALQPEGAFVIASLSPLEVRGEWGPAPWHQKRWHMTSRWVPKQALERKYGITLAEVQTRSMTSAPNSGEMSRLLYGAGYHGTTAHAFSGGDAATATDRADLVNEMCLWVRPERPGDPGRYLCIVGNVVAYDGPRPVQYPNTSPIRCFEFLRVPGRPSGTAPIAPLIQPQRAYNRRWAQLFEHAALVSNPKPVLDKQSGITAAQWSNVPGEPVLANKRPGVNAVDWLSPPPISSDVWRLMGELRSELDDLGLMRGAGGGAPTANASGELVKELRLNSDRPVGATLKRAVEEWARWNEDIVAAIPVVWPFEKVVRYAGEDNRARTVTLQPQLFKLGKVDVVADAESMLPEGRGERQQRVRQDWLEGAFGPKDSPQAIRTYLSLARFPHMGRAAKPGGVDHTTAEQENGQMLSGALPPVLEWYDHLVHLDVHEQFMKAPEFLKLPPEVQELFVMHRAEHMQGLLAQMPPEPAPANQGAPPPDDGAGPPPPL